MCRLSIRSFCWLFISSGRKVIDHVVVVVYLNDALVLGIDYECNRLLQLLGQLKLQSHATSSQWIKFLIVGKVWT